MGKDYGDWAYLGDAIDYTGEPMDVARMSGAARRVRKSERLPRNGAQCGEFLFNADDIDFERADSGYHADGLRRFGSGIIWAGISNPVVIVHFIRSISIWAVFVGVFSSALLLSVGSTPKPVIVAVFVVLPALLYLAARILIKMDAIPHINNTVFHRDTGMIEIPRGWFRKPEYLPFAEFDPHVIGATPWTGATRYRLLLAHRQSERIVVSPGGGVMEKATAAAEWEQLEQYMDITRPIPEVPDLEGIRGDDPTTVAWDAASGRPARFWPNMTESGFMALQRASREPAKKFPWGLTRREAYAEGWRPSPHGALVAGEIRYSDFVEWLKEQGYWKETEDAEASASAMVDEPQPRSES